MAAFVKPPGGRMTGFDAAAGVQFLRASHRAVVVLEGGDGLSVDIDDNNVAALVEVTAASGARTFEVNGVHPGKTVLKAVDAQGVTRATLRIQVNTELNFDEILADYEIDEDTKRNLSPEDLKLLKDSLKDLREHPPARVELHSDRFDATDMVKDGEQLPPNWHRKKS